MKKLLITVFILFTGIHAIAQTYTDWDEHDVVRFYEKVELDSYALDEDGEDIDAVFIPTTVNEGIYEVEVYKVSSKLYQIRGTSIYMLFRFTPLLYNYDEGILEVSTYGGVFYEEP